MADTQQAPKTPDVPPAVAAERERLASEIESGVELRHTETKEKVVLPDAELWKAVQEEKREHLSGIEQFDTNRLSHVEPTVKTAMPTKEEIAADQLPKQVYKKVSDAAAQFDRSQLKHADTKVTTDIVVNEANGK